MSLVPNIFISFTSISNLKASRVKREQFLDGFHLYEFGEFFDKGFGNFDSSGVTGHVKR